MQKKFGTRGTTLVELLVASVFLGLCASAMLTAIASAQSKADVARLRSIALGLAQDEIANARSAAANGTLTIGTTATTRIDTGIRSVTITRTVAAVVGFTDLYSVSATVTFNRDVKGNTAAETVTISTMVRQPDA